MSTTTLQDGRTARLVVPGMGSDHCGGIVSGSIRRLPGILEVGTNIAAHRVTVRFDPARSDVESIRDAVERAGSEHPLGQVIVVGTRERGLDAPDVVEFRSTTGRGVEGRRVRVGSRRLLE